MSEHTEGKVKDALEYRRLMLNGHNHINDNIRGSKLWNAADGMSNEDVVKALENYEEMRKALLGFISAIKFGHIISGTDASMTDNEVQYYMSSMITNVKNLLAKLEDK